MPRPPSLNLPVVVKDLAAIRVGDQVQLRWTTSAKNTDKLNVSGPMTAEICREAGVPVGQKAAVPVCAVVARMAVKPGSSDATDALSAALAAGTPELLAYRVRLLNAAGRSAGPSDAVFVPSGQSPERVEGLRATATKLGALVRWQASTDAGSDAVELERTMLETAVKEKPAAPERKPGLLGGRAEARLGPGPAVAGQRLRVAESAPGAADPGGTLDRSAQTGDTYTYTAQRVRKVGLAGKTLEMRSAESAKVTVKMLDVFPPNPPNGLVASPEFIGATGVAIDLSWEAGMEARIAGYRVYRRLGDGGAWERLTTELVPVGAYRDARVTAGGRYGYRVTAVDETGNESGPSGEVFETAPGR